MLRLLIPFFLFATGLGAQTLERSFGLELTPHLNQRRVSGVGSVDFQQLDRIDSLERGNVGYGVGLVYESRVERIGYTTGLRYTRAGYETLQQAVAGDAGARYSDRITAHYLALPFELNFYQDISEEDRVLFLLGVAAQVHLGTRVERTSFRNGEETGTAPTGEDIDYRRVVTSFMTGIAYDRKLSRDWAIRIQPTFQFFLNGNLQPDEDTLANRNYYQLGLRVVVRRLFI